MTCAHQNGPLKAYRWTQRSQGGRPTFRRPCPGFCWTVKLCCHTRGPQPSCDTRRNSTPALRLYCFCGSDNRHDNPCCYLISLLFASVPFLSGGSAACPLREGERIGKEWVIDKSLLDFSLFTYIFILLCRIYLHRIFQHRFSRRRLFQRR